MTDTAQKANQIASNGLRFFFAPQIGSGLKPTKLILLSFVQIIAQFLATAKLIPADHRALRPLSKNDARLGEVLALAFANVRKPGTRIDQWTVFLAVNCLAALIAIMIGYTAFNLLIGTAHAFTITVTFNEPGCTYTGGGSLFSTGCANDMAQQWVDMLLMSGTAGYVAPWFAGQIVSAPVAAGLNAMFSTYSTAMLVLAGFLVMYHLLVIVAGTAHEGKFGGRMMNQVWAPIRLVAAIGMLVPLGGLNSGQYMVVQTAKMGSALASNVWMNFANSYAANTGAYLMYPTMPSMSGFTKEALRILICEAGVNTLGSGGDFKMERGTGSNGKTFVYNFNYKNNLSAKDDSYLEACGRIEIADPAYTAGGKSFSYLSLNNGINANDTLRRDILLAHKKAVENMIAMGSPLQELAQKIFDAANGSVSGYTLTWSDMIQFNTAIANYRSDLSAGITAGILGSAAVNSLDLAKDAMARGWVSAAVWFNNIAKTNGMLLNYANYTPTATFRMDVPLEPKYLAILDTALEKSEESVAAIPSIAASLPTPVTLAEPDATMVYSGVGQGDSEFSFFMNTLQNNLLKTIGNTTGQTGDETGTACGTPPCAVSKFELNTGNPLAELSALGHRLITYTVTSVKELTACQRKASIDMYQTRLGGKQNTTDGVYAKSADRIGSSCTGGDGGVNVTYFMIQSVVGSMLMAGITLAFILPLIPFIRFMFGIMAWILSLLETVVAIPVVALAHIKMEGEGLAGPMARTAYLLLLQLFLRPTLMVFGLILALLIFNLMIVALNEFYTDAIRSIEAGGANAALGGVVYTGLYGVLAYAMANASFKAIDLIPNQCLQWIGGSGMNSLAGEAEAATSRFSSGAGQISSGALSQVNTAGRISGATKAAEDGYNSKVALENQRRY